MQDETAGHHLAEACRLLRELGRDGPREHELAASASARLEAAGEAALRRGDAPAGARLLERAAALAPGRPELLPRLGAALLEAGRLADADDAMTRAIEDPVADDSLRARARVERALVRLQTGEDGEAPGAVADEALDVLSRDRDDDLAAVGRCTCARSRPGSRGVRRRPMTTGRALPSTRTSGRRGRRRSRSPGGARRPRCFGPMPVPEAIARCAASATRSHTARSLGARTLHPLAALHAMAGDRRRPCASSRDADAVLHEVGDLRASIGQEPAIVELLAGMPDAAEARLRAAYEQLEAMGEKALLADTAGMLARVLFDAGRLDEADEVAAVGEQAAAGRGPVGADRRGAACARGCWPTADASSEAEALAREAVRLAADTDFLVARRTRSPIWGRSWRGLARRRRPTRSRGGGRAVRAQGRRRVGRPVARRRTRGGSHAMKFRQ